MKRKSSTPAKTLQKIGKKLTELRKESGYDTVKDFAEDNDLPPIQYWKVEHGKTNLTMKTLTNILSIHKVKVEDFFCDDKQA